MKIPQATKILTGIIKRLELPDPEKDALKLGIEALTRIETCRITEAAAVELPLPGETER